MKTTAVFLCTLLCTICISNQVKSQIIEIYAGGGNGDYQKANSTSVNSISVACHKNGDIYVYDFFDYRIRKISNGIVTTFAGIRKKGFSGDDGPATQARIGGMCYLALDTSGNLYISDTENNRIRKVDAHTGIITTIAGTGAIGYSDSIVLAKNARISSPSQIIIDSLGNLYFTDYGHNHVRKINLNTGLIYRVAGYGHPEDFGDAGVTDGIAYPKGLALDSKTNTLYIADAGHEKIKKVNLSTGKIYSVAGTGISGYAGENDSAFRATFNGIEGITLDNIGQLFICDRGNSRIRKINTINTKINTYAGSFALQNTYDSIHASLVRLLYPTDVKMDHLGNLLIVDAGNSLLRKVDSATKIVSNIAGNGYLSFGGDSGLATQSLLSTPRHIKFDNEGNLIFSDAYNVRIRRINASDKRIITLAGKGYVWTIDSLKDNVPGPTSYLWNHVTGVTTDLQGNVYLSEMGRIKKIDKQTGIITHYAGKGYPFNQAGFAGDGDSAHKALFYQTDNLGRDLKGNIYVVDYKNNRIRKINTNTQIITTVAGNGTLGQALEKDSALKSPLDLEGPMTVDGEGNIYIASLYRIRKIDAKTGHIYTIAGNLNDQYGYAGDGDSAKYSLVYNVRDLAVDASGNLYFSDAWNNRIRRIDVNTQIITTVAGNGLNILEPPLDSALKSSVFFPGYVACDPQGNIYFTYGGIGDVICRVANTAPLISNNVISGSQIVCKIELADTLVGSIPNGGLGAFKYMWFRSNISADFGFTIAPGDNTGPNYAPPLEAVSYWYKRLAISGGRCDTSAAVLVMVSKPSASTIVGEKEVLTNSIKTYSIKNASPKSTFNWLIKNGVILSTQADSITVAWSAQINLGIIKAIETDSLGCIGDTIQLQANISKQTLLNKHELNEHFLHVYPNPATTNFTLKNNTNQNITWQIFTSTGNKILASTLKPNQENNFSCAHLSPGIYLIYAEKDGCFFKYKLVINQH